MDETPIWFDMPRGCTIAAKGTKQVRIRGTGADKKRISVVLTATATGEMLKPMVIFKGSTPRSIKDITVDRNRVAVVHQQKAYMDSTIMQKWVKDVLLQHTKKVHSLLVFDAFRAHEHEAVAEALRRGNVQTAIIPAGCTSKVQPVDVSLNKPFKAIVKHKWEQYMQDSAKQDATLAKIPTPSKKTLVEWIIEANEYLTNNAEVVSKAFKVCGISNALDGCENYFVHCAQELPSLQVPYGMEDDSDECDPFVSESESESHSEDEESDD